MNKSSAQHNPVDKFAWLRSVYAADFSGAQAI